MTDTLVLTFALLSGDFHSELRLPLPKNKAETDKAVEHWLDFMLTGLRINAERMDAVLEDDTKEAGFEP